MRQRPTLSVVLCLLAVTAALPVSAQDLDREAGRARFEFRDLWAGLVAWVEAVGLTADPNGLIVPVSGPTYGVTLVTLPGDQPAVGLDADPNG
jgi:hypothetical protein